MAQTLSGVPQVSGVSTGHDKSIASLWSGVSSTESLDLRSYRAGTSQTMKFEFDNGMTCECLAQSTGVGDLMVLSQCKVGSGSTGDPGCSTFADTYNLSTTVDANSNANLKVCDSKTSCELFR
ncbi:MAG: hypothetical protein JST80_01880 [Bdellovibrionales bacterium]|nr:hypothetical protein [Bdellovibrionales bacterium]